MHPRRGEVWWVAFDPAVGGEIQKARPAVIVSNNAANTVLNRVIALERAGAYQCRVKGDRMLCQGSFVPSQSLDPSRDIE